MTTLVTGGSGFIARRLRLQQPDWVYTSSKDYNLLDPAATKQMFKDIRPNTVVHLAARVGGIKDNNSNQVEFFEQNVLMNINVLRAAYEAGVHRVLAAISTCAFPDVVDHYPFTEENIFSGPCAETNFSYGYSKRLLHALVLSYRKQYGVDYSTFSPSNVYGPDDHFDSENSHFIAALITKLANLKDGDTLSLWGTGEPLRQQLYVDDLCEIIPLLVQNHHGPEPIIVAPNENLSINEMAKILISHLNIDINIVYNKKLEGQHRKDGANELLKKTIGPYTFTPFDKGVAQTYNWYRPF
tara:strand:+ start:18262 stop:19155 length:894 start_codon:yes stop_codon:yes gene_type:complete